MKLFVHRRARRRGLARALMLEVESEARRLGRTLLVMDTRQGGEAEKMCGSLGYMRYGEVPGYARSGDGQLHTTVFFIGSWSRPLRFVVSPCSRAGLPMGARLTEDCEKRALHPLARARGSEDASSVTEPRPQGSVFDVIRSFHRPVSRMLYRQLRQAAC